MLTNSAGGITRGFGVGDLMVLTDHLNLTGENPLCGPNLDAFGPRFPDMTHAYDPALRAHILAAGQEMGLTLREGVYAGLLGPSYETPAEIRMLRVMGADAVGMSTVAEAIVARHAGVSEVTVELRDEPLRLRVADGGRGMAPKATPGVGLAGMRERAAILGGTLRIESDGGTTIVLEVPRG